MMSAEEMHLFKIIQERDEKIRSLEALLRERDVCDVCEQPATRRVCRTHCHR